MTHEAWSAALDRLEEDLVQAEQLARRTTGAPAPSSSTPWTAPAIDGAIPADLVDRARALLLRQEQAAAAVGAMLETVGRQQDFVAKVERATRPADPAVYLDVTA